MDTATVIGIAISAVAIVVVVGLVIFAFVEIMRDRALDDVSRLIWGIGIFLFPVLGALLWFLLRSRGLTSFPALARRLSGHS
jgi:hypothetical protein